MAGCGRRRASPMNAFLFVSMLIATAFACWANWAGMKWLYTRMTGNFPPAVRNIVIFSSIVTFVVMTTVLWVTFL
jgi:hypothetical protein